jgi:hypothetical protein
MIDLCANSPLQRTPLQGLSRLRIQACSTLRMRLEYFLYCFYCAKGEPASTKGSCLAQAISVAAHVHEKQQDDINSNMRIYDVEWVS